MSLSPIILMQAFGSAVRYGSPNSINDALPVLAQRACDPTPSVRSCIADVIGMWLLELPDRLVNRVRSVTISGR